MRIKPTLILLAIFAIGITFSSCKRTKDIELYDSDYLVFGHFYGECMGEGCVEIFRLERTQLLEDGTDAYPSSSGFYNANYITTHAQSTFDQVENLINFFPMDLLNETATRIGQPDAGDWGGLYIEYHVNGEHQFWLIDQKKSNVPSYLHDFIDKVNEKIAVINN